MVRGFFFDIFIMTESPSIDISLTTMKRLIATILAFAHYPAVWGQTQLLQTNSKSHLYYVDLSEAEGRVYTMGSYLDVAGRGYSIAGTDTLFKQPDGSYTGRNSRIIREKDELYLVSTSRKTRKYRLNAVRDPNLANNNLNNAYYLGRYFAMSKELNNAYPLNHHTFRGGYYTWEALLKEEKEMSYLPFREWADKRLKEIKDSTSAAQDKYTRLTNHITQNIRQMDYAALKDSLSQLPAEYAGKSRYYGTVIDTVAVQQPEYFFRLAEDFPQHRSLIFWSGVHTKRAHAGLESVEGHDEMKKTFFKERKFNKAFPFYALGSAALGAGLLALIIIAF